MKKFLAKLELHLSFNRCWKHPTYYRNGGDATRAILKEKRDKKLKMQC